MTEKRVQFSQIVKNQLPSYVREEFPLIGEFLSQYYRGQEYQGGPIDLVHNIDSYIKLNECGRVVGFTSLSSDIDLTSTTISVENTSGFPKNYGLLKINDEIITYTGITTNSFTGCIRGFSGITSFRNPDVPEDLIFSTSSAEDHNNNDRVINLSSLFLDEFLKKIKKQFLPGIANRELIPELDDAEFIRHSKDFYSTRGTDVSFKILFKSLYGVDVEVIRPKDYVISPSNANYRKQRSIIVEAISGDPFDIVNNTLFQDEFENIPKASSPVANVEKINVGILTGAYYRLGIDGSYIQNTGTSDLLYDKFSVHSKTKVIGEVGIGQTIISVDSTLGFPESGTLSFTYKNTTTGIVTYASKTINQFLDVVGLAATIADGADIDQNTYAYSAGLGQTDGIRVKIRSVLNDIDIPNNTHNQKIGSRIKIKSLGKIAENDVRSNNWLFNTAPYYEVQSMSLIDSINGTYRLITKDNNILRIGDSLKLTDNESQNIFGFVVQDVFNETTCLIRGFGVDNPNDIRKITRVLSKCDSDLHQNLNEITGNVQNVYIDSNKNLIASPSLPAFAEFKLNPKLQKYIFSGTYTESSDTFKITDRIDHNYFTGDAVYYTPEKNSNGDVISSLGFAEGLYFVLRVDENNIKLAKSTSNLYNNIFARVISSIPILTINNNTIEKYSFNNQTIKPQKLLREIADPVVDEQKTETPAGYTGILINGVEVLNYKSKDTLYYGGIEKINVVSGGKNYDIVNPPTFRLKDINNDGFTVGSGATGYPAILGKFSEIRVLNPGFDYINVPVIKISGGNPTRVAKAEAKLVTVPHEVVFNSTGIGSIGIGSATLSIGRIGFSTHHKFRNAEKVLYKTFGYKALSGLSTNATYYISVIDPQTIKLHQTLNDAVIGINTIVISDYGIGNHSIVSLSGKSILSSVVVTDTGEGYQTKKRTCGTVGIVTTLDTINITDHDYKDGEIVTYSVDGTAISGLSTSKQYYVTVVDKDNFKLSVAGVGTTVSEYYYLTKQFENLTSVGLGTHIFNYPDIRVEIIGSVGISSIEGKNFQAVLQPIVRGEITSIHLASKGVGYGSSEVLNLQRWPEYDFLSGQDAEIKAIVDPRTGKIIDTVIDNAGFDYNSPPKLIVKDRGAGTGAILVPELGPGLDPQGRPLSGTIKKVNINQAGIGYGVSTTTITVESSGSGAILSFDLQSWKVNEFIKNLNNLSNDDVFVSRGTNINNELQCSYVYAPRKLRESIYATDQGGRILYGKKDLTIFNGAEKILNENHSPIIGWAYDGHPIYGPFGYSTKSGGIITQLKSGYSLDLKQNRPPLRAFPVGFFVEDYTWNNSIDEDVLDENNGRFCVTPEFPNGTYAYFATFDTTPASDGIFQNYKTPKFPYLIGKYYNSKPNSFNFKKKSNQDDIDLNKTNWIRNTHPYVLRGKTSGYEYVTQSYKYVNQDSIIKHVRKGSVDFVGIVTGGNNYKVNDRVVFEQDPSDGFFAAAKVSKVFGIGIGTISVSNSRLTGLEFYPTLNVGEFIGVYTGNHGFLNQDILNISGLSTTSSFLEGPRRIGVTTSKFILNVAISGDASTTGIVTYFSLFGNLRSNSIEINDFLRIDNEEVKILNIDSFSSRVRVLRGVNGTVSAAHTAQTPITSLPRRFSFNVGYNTSFNPQRNREYYFNPRESVGIGTTAGVGIGKTLSFSNPGVGITQYFVSTRAIYLPYHGFETGDIVTYQTNTGSTIGFSTVSGGSSISLSNQSMLFIAKLDDNNIGLSTVKVGLGTTGTFVGIASTTKHQGLMYFVGFGTGTYHSFKISYPTTITGNVEKNLVTVSTAGTHGLFNGDTVYVDVNPAISTTFNVRYNQPNRKLITTGIAFTSGNVLISTNAINIADHNLVTGQKIIHTSSSPSGGLESDKEYYVYVVDRNNIKLATTKFNASQRKPEIISINSTSSGTIFPINPPIKVYKNSTVNFDLSDLSLSYDKSGLRYPAFKFELYTDSKFKNVYETNATTSKFDVTRAGIVGVTTNAKVTININEFTPSVLYYRLVALNVADNPVINKEIVNDNLVDLNNQIITNKSSYSGEYTILKNSDNTFTYGLSSYPEKSQYNSSDSKLTYTTNSLTAYGSITSVILNSRGKGYTKVPGISTVSSLTGTGAILEASSKTIGQIEKSTIENIGFDYSSDKTLSPEAKIPQILRIEQLAGFSTVGVTSFGKNYSIEPKLVVIDGRTKQWIKDVDLRYVKDQKSLTIVRNTFSLSNITPTILPVQNSNGIRVSNMTYNSSTQDVTATLKDPFSINFPFAINDKILVENTSVGIGSTGLGYNSSNYNYTLFTITKVHPNLGGIGIVTFNMGNVLKDGEIPGVYDTGNSSGIIVPSHYFPQFTPSLQTFEFRQLDSVTDGVSQGTVYTLDKQSKYLVVESDDDFEVGTELTSQITGAKGLVKERIFFDSKYKTDYFSVTENGWEYVTGFLNNPLQKIHDNEYYQNFSYSIKSSIPYENWNNIVSTLNHTSGFKKFSDLQVESTPTIKLTPTSIDGTSVIIKMDSLYNLNSYYNYDLVHENYLTNKEVAFSDEINFTTRILTDYSESITNRVLRIDDISPLFNSEPRPTPFNEVFRRTINEAQAQKFITLIKDRLFTQERQILLVTTLTDSTRGLSMLNQYGRVESVVDLGSFDSIVEGSDSVLRFYPNKFKLNNYNVVALSYSMDKVGDVIGQTGNTTIGIGSTTGLPGSLVSIASSSVSVGGGSSVTIATLSGIGTVSPSTRSAKIITLVETNDKQVEYNELNLVHDGTNIEVVQYGQLSIHSQDAFSATSVGTYDAYLSDSSVIVSFTSNLAIGSTATINSIVVGLASEGYVGSGEVDFPFASLVAKTTSINSSGSPVAVGIASFSNENEGAYCLVQVADTTNNEYQFSEVIILDDNDEIYLTEYGNVETSSSLGSIDGVRTGDITELRFTPNPGIDVRVNILLHTLRDTEDTTNISSNIDLNNASVENVASVYTGTEVDVKRDFFLTHKNKPVFVRVFDGSNSGIVSTGDSKIFLPNHYFVSGEEIVYSTAGLSTNAIGIAQTTISGIGLTDKLPTTAYIIKLNEKEIQLAATAQNALRVNPVALQFTSVGIGTSHVITSTKQKNKVLISIDNQIQAPIVATSVTTTLSQSFPATQDIAYFVGLTSFFGGDSIQIDNEIMKIQGVGIGSTNAIKVSRALAGTALAGHSTGATVTKLKGDYNIVGSTLSFLDPPFGRSPIGTSVGPTDRRDFIGITSSSSFSGRTFMRSGIVGGSDETYTKNYIFDDISQNFSGLKNTYTLKSNKSDIIGISTLNGIVLINGIFQGPGATRDYNFVENSGITSISFTGTASTNAYEPNDLNIPIGGVIVSVSGTTGFGYQPLVSAGGTAVVSIAGTISSISIGNSGSGYRSGIQTNVRVAVASSSRGTPSLTFIGTAAISGGNIVSIAITNPGIGYTRTNPPEVIIDAPLPYSKIPLQYSSASVGSGGTGAKVSIVVGQGSNVIEFTVTNFGYGYGLNHVLTIPTGGATGIPTTVGFGTNSSDNPNEFRLEVIETNTDSFSGWTLGEIEVLDDFSSLFDGERKTFPITRSGEQLSLQSDLGSLVNIEDVLLIFINDVLQVPGSSYFFIENRRGPFGGGSHITFEEAPKAGDTLKFLFYKGTSGTDVFDKDVVETIKTGDELTIGYHPTLNQESFQKQNTRVVTEIDSSSAVNTNVYYGPGLNEDSTLYRPVVWKKQTEDKIINGNYVYKNREQYESEIYPTAIIIKTVGIGTTVAFVDSVRPFFNPINESSINLNFQKDITLVDYTIDKVGAAATVNITDDGTIDTFVISNGGIGYTSSNPPFVAIQSPVGFGTTCTATATAKVSAAGTVYLIESGIVGLGYTNNPNAGAGVTLTAPVVLIAPPTITQEKNTIISYEGDFGIITGIATTSTAVAPIGLNFDLIIPENSVLRNSTITNYTSLSGLQTGYYFCVFNSNVGSGVTSLDETNNPGTGIIGIGSTFIDNIYRVAHVSTATTSAIGFGVTTVTRVTVSVSSHRGLLTGLGFSSFYGEYSWGKLQLSERNKYIEYIARTQNGYSGIGTGPYVRRTKRLKYRDYST